MSKQAPQGKSRSVVINAIVLGALVLIAIVAGSIIGILNQNKRAAGPITPGAVSSPSAATSP